MISSFATTIAGAVDVEDFVVVVVVVKIEVAVAGETGGRVRRLLWKGFIGGPSGMNTGSITLFFIFSSCWCCS